MPTEVQAWQKYMEQAKGKIDLKTVRSLVHERNEMVKLLIIVVKALAYKERFFLPNLPKKFDSNYKIADEIWKVLNQDGIDPYI